MFCTRELRNLNRKRNAKSCNKTRKYSHIIQNEPVIKRSFYENCLSFAKNCVILPMGIGLVTSAQQHSRIWNPHLATKISSEGVNLDKQAFNASWKTIAAQKAAGQNLSPAEVWYSGNQPGATTKYPSFCSSFTIRLARLRSLCFLRISKQSSLYGEPVFNIV